MSKRMLVDALHPEETRLIIADGSVIEEFDYQNALKKSTKGNVYLAKVLRVEPSLQAAFVEYGAEHRLGFLPFAEIHPDYYQLPAADKEKLLKQLENSKAAEVEEDEAEVDGEEVVEGEASQETAAAKPSAKSRFQPSYKIQEVIKKDQVLLVQIAKEERGTKGASVTTLISLAGRYCVLMPNSTSNGGISRKVADNAEKKRMKAIVSELIGENNKSTSLILRTAGAYKSKIEIKRDFTYLSKLWDNIRSHTLASKAPAFIHEEGNMLKRAIRDLYTNDIEEIVIQGNDAFKEVHSFMQMLMPRHASKVKEYVSNAPIFGQYNVESQVSSFYDPVVSLPSGGYLVINQTEALVSIDVNSGRSNKERNVEETALKTNLEAAMEVAKQLRLRDLSGIVVIDFIDMYESKHKRKVEACLAEAASKDRARLQMNKISSLGLLEMSRQRIGQSFTESNTQICPHCDGRGRVRLVGSSAISVLRAIANEIEQNNFAELKVSAGSNLIFYLLNSKRKELSDLEVLAGAKITLSIDEEAGADGFFMEQVRSTPKKNTPQKALSVIDAPIYNEDGDADEEVVKEEMVAGDRNKKMKRKGQKPMRSDQQNNVNHNDSAFSRNKSKRNWRNVEAVVPSAAEQIEEVAPEMISHESTPIAKEYNKKRNRRNNRNKRNSYNEQNKAIPVIEDANSSDAEESFDKSMEEKRQQNQSLLREIWKKFVD